VFLGGAGVCFFVFFFFKQKTAYEIKFGDWSSDVCSSDLAQTKQRELANLRTLTRSARYEEAIRGYDAYLARHPHSTVALAERAEAQRLHDATLVVVEPEPEPEPKRIARKPKREKVEETAVEPAEPEAPAKKPGRWERVKRWFRGS